ncbi:unnamed protein product, partial [Ectocarpus sp. 12 AP-2014]
PAAVRRHQLQSQPPYPSPLPFLFLRGHRQAPRALGCCRPSPSFASACCSWLMTIPPRAPGTGAAPRQPYYCGVPSAEYQPRNDDTNTSHPASTRVGLVPSLQG